ncbi:protein adenylyltransferase SelO [Acuticoccus sp.]|uniref:protein adenylyltransferase SelO n=1 Tax=Acuticoccus sp. TaxID=1904378 RepID=UPI003B51BB20
MVDAATTSDEIFAFDNSYVRLPERMFARVSPAPAREPRLLLLNRRLAEELRIDPDRLGRPDAVEVLAGNRIAEGSDPIAMAYAGHQFGNWVPQLGDGRAVLLGEVIDRNGQRRDVQLKGSGRTPFSRMGDGKAPLGPVLREFIVSEAMAALGVPTTRSLAAVATGERVYREDALSGAVLTRVAASHVRVGTFQYFYARDDVEALKALADHVTARHYPEVADAEAPALSLFEAVKARQADLVARWMGVGFIHGVMNTDNMTISGETIDYGPCAFMDAHREGQVFSSIDVGGRYAYGNQPRIAHWNLVQLAQALLPLLPGSKEAAVERMQASVDAFPELFQTAWLGVMRRKLGLSPVAEARAVEEDAGLAADLLSTMEANGADFTLTFRGLAALAPPETADGQAVRDFFADPGAFDAWVGRWTARLAADPMSPAERRVAMNQTNPLFIPRNHRVEEALAAAEEGDLGPLETLRAVLARPFEDQAEHVHLAQPPLSEDAAYRTFCGT